MSGLSFESLETSQNSTSQADSLSNFNLPQVKGVVLFDWDDTLFCTKYLEIHDINLNEIFSFHQSVEDSHPSLSSELRDLENAVLELFEEILERKNDIFIVSNANGKWIENCLIHFLPELNSFINENEIKIYSAKNLFSRKFAMEKWKSKCFKKVINDNFKDKNAKLNVVCIGDSNEEKLAAFELRSYKRYKKIKVKFVELIKGPSVYSLISQLNYVKENFISFADSKWFLHKLNFGERNHKIEITALKSENKKKYIGRKRKLMKNELSDCDK